MNYNKGMPKKSKGSKIKRPQRPKQESVPTRKRIEGPTKGMIVRPSMMVYTTR